MKKMMLAFLIVPALFLLACSSALQVTEIDSWLSAKAGGAKASVNITGKWQDSMNDSNSFLSWGQGELIQKGDKVTGNIGTYVISGIVSGNSVYLVLYDKMAVQYTAKFELRDNKELYGSYYSARDRDQTGPTPMAFKKL